MQLHPWRKGPYEICGIPIETEWRSDWKWERLQPHIEPLADRLVLDVGCGNGYHGWRMLGEGARLVIGIDPTQLFVMQFEALRHFLGSQHPLRVLPLGIEDLPANLQGFDTVFSMGVFYHRRSPFAHLAELKGALRKGGELVLETLVIEGDGGPGAGAGRPLRQDAQCLVYPDCSDPGGLVATGRISACAADRQQCH